MDIQNSHIPVVPGQAGGGSFKEKNYKSKKEFAYRMRARRPTSAMPKSFLCCERAFCRSMVVMFCALKWSVLMSSVAGSRHVMVTWFAAMWWLVLCHVTWCNAMSWWWAELLQYYSVLQSTTPVLPCSTKYYSRTTNTTLYYSSTTLYYKYYSSTTLYYKVPLKYYKVLLQYYKAAIGKEQILKMYQDCKMWILVDFSCYEESNFLIKGDMQRIIIEKMHIFLWITESNQGSSNLNPSIGNLCQDSACVEDGSRSLASTPYCLKYLILSHMRLEAKFEYQMDTVSNPNASQVKVEDSTATEKHQL